MNLSLRITGPAGMGFNSLGHAIGRLVSSMGYHVLGDIEYESRIKGWVNQFDIFVSDSKAVLSKRIDILIAFDKPSLLAHLDSLNENATVISTDKIIRMAGDALDPYNTRSFAAKGKFANIALLSLCMKYLQVPHDVVEAEIRKTFKHKGEEVIRENLETMYSVYDAPTGAASDHFSLTDIWEEKQFISGSAALAKGAMASSLEFYSAYPMTPANTILQTIVDDGRVSYLQPEDEIAVAMSALGAAYTGKRAMLGTSGGGFALMSEALSFSVQAEIPLVAVLWQRSGPSTGTPTFHEQGDINYALHPSFGDFYHVVLCPSSIQNAYFMASWALNIADVYQQFVIVLTDKQFAEGYASVNAMQLSPCQVQRGKILDIPEDDYARYALDPDGISPRVHVGTKNGDFIASSYEHGEHGQTSEDPSMKEKMTQKRFAKLQNFYENEERYGYEIINSDAANKFVVFSYNTYVIKEFLKHNPEWGAIVVQVIKPLDPRMKTELIECERLVFVENNYSGQFEHYVRKEFGLDGSNIQSLRKYNNYPIYKEDVEDFVKNL